MTLEKFNEIIDGALEEIAHGMIVNASGNKGEELKRQLRSEFDFLIELGAAARTVAAEKFSGAVA